jgi:hypothetical protein
LRIDPDTDRNRIANFAPVEGSQPAQPGAKPSRQRRPWAPLLRSILTLGGDHAILISHVEREWSSATFSGTRHAITLSFNGAEAIVAGEQYIATLPDHSFTIPRHLVADVQITRVEQALFPDQTLVVEADMLLLEDA